jgi:hypothetical protein
MDAPTLTLAQRLVADALPVLASPDGLTALDAEAFENLLAALQDCVRELRDPAHCQALAFVLLRHVHRHVALAVETRAPDRVAPIVH